MHPIFHSFKRTHWSSMRYQRAWMDIWKEECGVTPARFDMMIVIHEHFVLTGTPIRQVQIRDTLDVCGRVVSVMLEALGAWGLIDEPTRDPRDRRHNIVSLTDHGRAVLAEISAQMLTDGLVERAVRTLLDRGQGVDDARSGRILHRSQRFLRYLRKHLRDRSTHVYPAYLPDGRRDPSHPFRHPRPRPHPFGGHVFPRNDQEAAAPRPHRRPRA